MTRNTSKRSSASSSSASVNTQSEGRTTVKSLTVISINGEFQQSIAGNVKGTSAGNLYGTLRKQLNSQGKSIKSALPATIDAGYTEVAGPITFKYVLLLSPRQCPMCGSNPSSPMNGCPECSKSLNFSDQDAKDFAESSQ